MSWAPLLKISTQIFGKSAQAIKASGKIGANLAAKSPEIARGISSIGSTIAKPAVFVARNPKTAIIAPGVAYAGWKGLVDRQPLWKSTKEYGKGLMDVAIGEDASADISNDLGKAQDTLTDMKDTVTEGKSLLGSLNESLGGVKSFVSNITHGEGMNMFGNFFGNITKGNVSGMSMIGLLAAGFLTFGRFGWLGKIAGALLGMTMIGNNSAIQRTPQVSEQVAPQLAKTETESKGYHR